MGKGLFYLMLGLTCSLIAATLQSCNNGTSNSVDEEHLPDQVSYNFDIRPILSDKCFKCHGPDANKRQAGLRLDIAENAYKALDENPSWHALVPGEPMLSQVFLRISSQDSTTMMPPVESNLALTAHQIKLIEKWIKQGAEYESHWAFVAPQKPGVPDVTYKAWPKNEIDHFILQKQEQKGIKPNEEADKEHLLKRV